MSDEDFKLLLGIFGTLFIVLVYGIFFKIIKYLTICF